MDMIGGWPGSVADGTPPHAHSSHSSHALRMHFGSRGTGNLSMVFYGIFVLLVLAKSQSKVIINLSKIYPKSIQNYQKLSREKFNPDHRLYWKTLVLFARTRAFQRLVTMRSLSIRFLPIHNAHWTSTNHMVQDGSTAYRTFSGKENSGAWKRLNLNYFSSGWRSADFFFENFPFSTKTTLLQVFLEALVAICIIRIRMEIGSLEANRKTLFTGEFQFRWTNSNLQEGSVIYKSARLSNSHSIYRWFGVAGFLVIFWWFSDGQIEWPLDQPEGSYSQTGQSGQRS